MLKRVAAEKCEMLTTSTAAVHHHRLVGQVRAIDQIVASVESTLATGNDQVVQLEPPRDPSEEVHDLVSGSFAASRREELARCRSQLAQKTNLDAKLKQRLLKRLEAAEKELDAVVTATSLDSNSAAMPTVHVAGVLAHAMKETGMSTDLSNLLKKRIDQRAARNEKFRRLLRDELGSAEAAVTDIEMMAMDKHPGQAAMATAADKVLVSAMQADRVQQVELLQGQVQGVTSTEPELTARAAVLIKRLADCLETLTGPLEIDPLGLISEFEIAALEVLVQKLQTDSGAQSTLDADSAIDATAEVRACVLP